MKRMNSSFLASKRLGWYTKDWLWVCLGLGQNGAWQGVTVMINWDLHAWERIGARMGKEDNPRLGRRSGICFCSFFDFLMMCSVPLVDGSFPFTEGQNI